MSSFDPTSYVRAPSISFTSGISLADALLRACPEDAEPKIRKAADRLAAVANRAVEDMTERNRKLGASPDEESRILDSEADRAWGALRLRLQAYSMLGDQAQPIKERAAALDQRLYQGSTDFLDADYEVQMAHMLGILKRIEEEKLEAELIELAGQPFLEAVRQVQPRYEAMVKERLERDKAAGHKLHQTLRELQVAIVAYAGTVSGSVEHDDDKAAEAARLALLPLLKFREHQGEGPISAVLSSRARP